jgi:orotidine-5'-phosphate decarboxylase
MGVTRLALGIDPEVDGRTVAPGSAAALAAFDRALAAHESVLAHPSTRQRVRWLKPNLAFFLRHGSQGLARLERFVAEQRAHYLIELDAKFSEIENSLRGSLEFAFRVLGVHGVTLNAFLGERSVGLALELCGQHVGPNGRVHVLCRTSEASQGPLAHLQSDWGALVDAVAAQARAVAAGDPALALMGGVVVGAGRREVLLHPRLLESGLSVLAPGLGAQGADETIIGACAQAGPREILFPMSRGIFAGGSLHASDALDRIESVFAHAPSLLLQED